MTDFLRDGPEDADFRVLLAHGAGAPMDSPFMNGFSQRLAETGVSVLRFEFDYMAKRRADGKRRAPERARKLMERYRAVVAELGDPKRLVIGGKSMGGRIASMIADELKVAGLVCLGYPFHPPGKPQQLRTAHLETLHTPCLIVQGTRDRFGTQDEISAYRLSPSIELSWMEDGDHSFKPRKKSGRTEAQNLSDAARAASRFIVRCHGRDR